MNDIPPDLDALFARARAERPDTGRAEYAFETRLLARLRAAPSAEMAWGRASWRLLPLFCVIVLGLAFWDVQVGNDSRDAAQAVSAENPEAADLLATFN